VLFVRCAVFLSPARLAPDLPASIVAVVPPQTRLSPCFSSADRSLCTASDPGFSRALIAASVPPQILLLSRLRSCFRPASDPASGPPQILLQARLRSCFRPASVPPQILLQSRLSLASVPPQTLLQSGLSTASDPASVPPSSCYYRLQSTGLGNRIGRTIRRGVGGQSVSCAGSPRTGKPNNYRGPSLSHSHGFQGKHSAVFCGRLWRPFPMNHHLVFDPASVLCAQR
jgi:hypothetical protein